MDNIKECTSLHIPEILTRASCRMDNIEGFLRDGQHQRVDIPAHTRTSHKGLMQDGQHQRVDIPAHARTSHEGLMQDGQHQRVDVPAHASTSHKGFLQKRLEEDLC